MPLVPRAEAAWDKGLRARTRTKRLGNGQDTMAKPQETVPPPIEDRDASSEAAAGLKTPVDPATGPEETSAWNPYEVWRTRVKGPEGSSS